MNKPGGKSLESYLKTAAATPLLTADEEIVLSKIIKRGGKKGIAAKKRFAKANMLLVVSVATKVKEDNPVDSLSLSELIGEGNRELLRVVEKFDWKRGYRFSTYAESCMEKKLTSYCVAEKKRLSRDALKFGGDKGENKPLDSFIEDKKAVSPDAQANRCLVKQSLEAAIIRNGVTHREAEALTKLFGLDNGISRTLKQAGEEMEITVPRVRLLRNKALAKLSLDKNLKEIADCELA